MFPMYSPEAIKNAIDTSVNVHEAIDILLNKTAEEGLIPVIINYFVTKAIFPYQEGLTEYM